MWFFLSFMCDVNFVTINRNKKIKIVTMSKKIRTRYKCGSIPVFEVF